MRYTEQKEEIDVINITFNKKQARNVLGVLSSARFKNNINADARTLEAILDEWLKEEQHERH